MGSPRRSALLHLGGSGQADLATLPRVVQHAPLRDEVKHDAGGEDHRNHEEGDRRRVCHRLSVPSCEVKRHEVSNARCVHRRVGRWSAGMLDCEGQAYDLPR